MRRTLALVALAAGLLAPAGAASAAPQPDLTCYVVGHCTCVLVADVVYKATGDQLYCV
jgi:hypothetical protein